jgi:hypothetical protein
VKVVYGAESSKFANCEGDIELGDVGFVKVMGRKCLWVLVNELSLVVFCVVSFLFLFL